RDRNVTGVQTCALPIFADAEVAGGQAHLLRVAFGDLPDGAGVGAGVGERTDLPHQGGQAGGAAAGEQLGEAGGGGGGEVQHHAAGTDLGEEGGGLDPAGDLLGPAVQGVGDAVLPAQRLVLARGGGQVVLVLLGGDAGADLVEVAVHHDLVPVARLLRGGTGRRLLVGRLGALLALHPPGGGVPGLAALVGQCRQGVVTGHGSLARPARPLLPAQETPHGRPRYRRRRRRPRRRAVRLPAACSHRARRERLRPRAAAPTPRRDGRAAPPGRARRSPGR